MSGIVVEGYGVSSMSKLDVHLLLSSRHVPDSEHSITAHGDHLSLAGMHGEAPQLLIEVSSHADSRLLIAFGFDDFTATCANEDSVLGT